MSNWQDRVDPRVSAYFKKMGHGIAQEQRHDDDKRHWLTCPACHGERTQFSQKSGMRELCPACDGRGRIANPDAPTRFAASNAADHPSP